MPYGQIRVKGSDRMTSMEVTWATLLDDIDRLAHALPYVFFATCPATDVEICIVVDDDEFDPDEDVPAIAQRRAFTRGLLVDDVKQVIENLEQQDPTVGRAVLLRAIGYYFDRDAFIDLSR